MYGMRAQDNAPATHFRCDRLCRVNGELYFTTRELTLEGPFENREAAKREIQAYIERMQFLCMSR
ncbi:thiolase [Pseudomonas syringae]|uniref:Thiolase n=1 Tax=Pseudomonas syringae TaxID=317 RepID=A0A0L1MKW8_PSESX|nr:thiolase [Pseudomonas syringae]